MKTTPEGGGFGRELAFLIAGHIFLHACMAGMRMASPLLALREGYSEAAVGFLLFTVLLKIAVPLLLADGSHHEAVVPDSGQRLPEIRHAAPGAVATH